MSFLSNPGLREVAVNLRTVALVWAAIAGSTELALCDPIQISEVVAKQSAITKATPILPPIAKQAHLSGRVIVELSVGEDGNVSDAKVVSGNPILGMAASKAGKNWQFKPFAGADGKPTQALIKLTFDFEGR